LAEARQFLGVDAQQAILRYQEVRELDPDNAEALTYMGWLVAQGGPSTAAAGAEFLRGAIKLDPTYADPHCFLAITSARFLQPPDIDTARTEAQACLDNNPPSQMIGMIQGFIDSLGAPTTTG
jgi:cytochrome c-type biogenesis protein CcmH/NrfG